MKVITRPQHCELTGHKGLIRRLTCRHPCGNMEAHLHHTCTKHYSSISLSKKNTERDFHPAKYREYCFEVQDLREHLVEASPDELVVASVDVKREPAESPEAMSPDSNHNLQCSGQRGGLPEVEITMKLVKSEPQSSEDDSSQERDPKIQEYLGRTDTAVVFPEDPAGLQDNASQDDDPLEQYCHIAVSCRGVPRTTVPRIIRKRSAELLDTAWVASVQGGVCKVSILRFYDSNNCLPLETKLCPTDGSEVINSSLLPDHPRSFNTKQQYRIEVVNWSVFCLIDTKSPRWRCRFKQRASNWILVGLFLPTPFASCRNRFEAFSSWLIVERILNDKNTFVVRDGDTSSETVTCSSYNAASAPITKTQGYERLDVAGARIAPPLKRAKLQVKLKMSRVLIKAASSEIESGALQNTNTGSGGDWRHS
ncbi:hypothetical protein J6590_002208 [Homalodisca vitripennis]|nr:hypothetical protein J6590_002208 [Homalodisca vitripennis]